MSTPPDPERPHRGPILEPVRVLRPRRLDALAELMREIREEAEADEKAREAGSRTGGQTGQTGGQTGGRTGGQTGGQTAGRPGHGTGGQGGGRTAARPGEQAGGQAGNRTGGLAGGPSAPAGFEAVGGERWPDAGTEDDTQELPPVPGGPRTAHGPRSARSFGFGPGLRRAATVVAVGAAALVGFGCALLLPGRGDSAAAAQPAPSATEAPPGTAPATDTATDPDGAGTLREGDTGPEVVDLERRLLRVPDVYRDGSTAGTYDTALTAAVERFQIWYGISGDERGVYGDDTRRALESRTGQADG
ncbi:peptidoglycan-binding protein [Streptomyces sp. NPDC001068]|uniref:peptidoglycan-binding protein n=1 Tax=Streptomyces sp. NPDC001068 TaxID=3364544 RepID=UPI00367EDAF9